MVTCSFANGLNDIVFRFREGTVRGGVKFERMTIWRYFPVLPGATITALLVMLLGVAQNMLQSAVVQCLHTSCDTPAARTPVYV